MSNQTILIVDDEPIFLRSLKHHLTTKNNNEYRIHTANDGQEAIDIIVSEKIDLIILDINMPVMDGIEFLTELHNRKIWLPIIILTGVVILPTEEEVEIFGAYGIVDYMEKPVDFERLDKKVEEVLNRFEIVKKPSSGIGLPTILRVIESERRTGVLTVELDDMTCRIFFSQGEVVDAESKDLTAEQAYRRCIRPYTGEKKISIEYINHKRKKKLSLSVYEVLLEKDWLVRNTQAANETNVNGNQPVPVDLLPPDNLPGPEDEQEVTAASGSALSTPPLSGQTILSELSQVEGFLAAAIYHWDGEIVQSHSVDNQDLGRLGKLATTYFKSTTIFTQKMNWGSADFIELHTKEFIFIYTVIFPRVSVLGVITSGQANLGRIKLEVQKIIKTLTGK